ncbi:MAG: DUF3301 domain-containing protein [Thiohalocapsa sp.]|jgi:hypothetical protein|uniref:DUF3301 domain-containing protein n=1 Tax=Thiohalocapsa sp. TaxID=2497641 RepID=UPI0025CD5A6B|nr:DUF3301 domain-containing protein [Thiohalocapsa sp.]MCG6943393.1 DUF3301 domain-containing protein [Thiohalocapsa sp.]
MNPIMDNLTALLVVLIAGWLWLNTLRARELALAHARRACERAGVQLLDQAVALRSLSLRWTPQGLRVRRHYGFEFSIAGVERRNGRVVLLGLALERLELDADTDSDAPGDTGEARDGDTGQFVP